MFLPLYIKFISILLHEKILFSICMLFEKHNQYMLQFLNVPFIHHFKIFQHDYI